MYIWMVLKEVTNSIKFTYHGQNKKDSAEREPDSFHYWHDLNIASDFVDDVYLSEF